MSIHRAEAIVLNKRDFRETSIIADFYTRDFGRLSGILKGIRSEPLRFASTLEPFSYNEIIFYKKRNSQLHLVTQCDVRDNFDAVRRDMVKVGTSSLMMEMLAALMQPEDKNEDIFNLTLECLAELKNTFKPEKVLTIFRIKLLAFSGFKPHFDSCVSCGEKILSQSKFSLILGGLLCTRCCRKDAASRSIFRGTVASILHIERNDFRSNLNLGLNPQIKKELDVILNAFLNFHLEKDFKSQRVLNKLDNFISALK